MTITVFDRHVLRLGRLEQRHKSYSAPQIAFLPFTVDCSTKNRHFDMSLL